MNIGHASLAPPSLQTVSWRWFKGFTQRTEHLVGLDWRWLAAAVAIRVALSPLQHLWDSQTMWDAAAEIGAVANPLQALSAPYEHMRELSDFIRGTSASHFYEYWAYPPGMLILWWPIARLWAVLMGPMTPQFMAPGVFAAVPMPFGLSLALKAPIIAADVVIAGLLTRLGHARLARWYLFNPYVLLMGLWTFDAVMVALLLAGLYALKWGRWELSGALLGLGAAVKFVPLLFVPLAAMEALRRSGRPMRDAAVSVVAAGAVFLGMCAPCWNGVRFVVTFQSERFGGNMTWQSIWPALPQIDRFADIDPWYLSLSAEIGFLTLTGSLLLAALVIWIRPMETMDSALVLMLAYLIGSKLVNEVYVLPAVILAALVLTHRGFSTRHTLVVCLWLLPLLFAMVHGPGWTFLAAPGSQLGLTTIPYARLFQGVAVPYYARQTEPTLAVAGCAFQAICVWGVWLTVRRKKLAENPCVSA